MSHVKGVNRHDNARNNISTARNLLRLLEIPTDGEKKRKASRLNPPTTCKRETPLSDPHLHM